MNNNLLDNFKYFLLGVRANSRLHRSGFYKVSKIPTHTCVHLETGRHLPTLPVLVKYAEYLQCSVFEIFQAIESENHLSYLVDLGKQRYATEAEFRAIDAHLLLNKLSPEDREYILNKALKSDIQEKPND